MYVHRATAVTDTGSSGDGSSLWDGCIYRCMRIPAARGGGTLSAEP